MLKIYCKFCSNSVFDPTGRCTSCGEPLNDLLFSIYQAQKDGRISLVVKEPCEPEPEILPIITKAKIYIDRKLVHDGDINGSYNPETKEVEYELYPIISKSKHYYGMASLKIVFDGHIWGIDE